MRNVCRKTSWRTFCRRALIWFKGGRQIFGVSKISGKGPEIENPGVLVTAKTVGRISFSRATGVVSETTSSKKTHALHVCITKHLP